MISLGIAAMGLAIAGMGGAVYAEQADTSAPEMSIVEEDPASEAEWDWMEWLKGWVDPQTLTTVTAIMGALVAVAKMASSIKKLSKDKQLTVDNVRDVVLSGIREQIPEDVKAEMDKYMPKLIESADRMNDIMSKFAKILALSQENTPESRIAILGIIQQMGVVSNELIETAKAEIREKADEEEKRKEEQAQAVEGVISETGSYDGTSI